MRLPRKYFPIIATCAVLLVVAVAGYLTPAESQKLPVRILFDNTGGKVVFAHLRHHRDYSIACETCHHENAPQGAEPLPCGSCHPLAFDEQYVKQHVASFPDKTYCIQCHHLEYAKLNFGHDEHVEYAGGDCQACHHGPDIEPEPQSCRSCHPEEKPESGDSMPDQMEAGHTRCASCHQDMFDHGLTSCKSCHVEADMTKWHGDFTGCAQCHDEHPEKELVLTRTNAFHDQCMSCHEERRQGPYKDDDCNKCHIR
ncbi:MAG: cytochrome c3 family protein [Desulfocurvibacter africanus]